MKQFPHEAMQDRVVVLVEEPEMESTGGILLTSLYKRAPTEGIAVAVGPGKMSKEDVLLPMQVAIGDRVIFAQGTGKPVRIEGKEYFVLKEDEIFAIVGEDTHE